MRTVYKYRLNITDEQRIEVQKEAGSPCSIVHVGLDPAGVPCIWMELTPGGYIERHVIHIVGTGNPISGSLSHIGSFVQGPFVWHVYT